MISSGSVMPKNILRFINLQVLWRQMAELINSIKNWCYLYATAWLRYLEITYIDLRNH